jgi:hypothetical protein
VACCKFCVCIIGLELVISSEDTFYASYFVEEDVQTQRLTADIMMMMAEERNILQCLYLHQKNKIRAAAICGIGLWG